jgi:hypothetical protein
MLEPQHTPERRPITSAAIWHTNDVGTPDQWTYVLNDQTRAAIVATAERLRVRGVTLDTVTRSDLDDAGLGPLVADWTRELADGRGFVLVRGFPVDHLDTQSVELAYFALGLQFGRPVSQDAQGTLLGHVRDTGIRRTTPAIRRYATNERQDFHTDGADIIGLLCLRRARHGGQSRIVSAAAVYNEILRRDPAALEVLYAPMYWTATTNKDLTKHPSTRYLSSTTSPATPASSTSAGTSATPNATPPPRDSRLSNSQQWSSLRTSPTIRHSTSRWTLNRATSNSSTTPSSSTPARPTKTTPNHRGVGTSYDSG